MPKNGIHKRNDGKFTYKASDQLGKRHQIVSRKGETKTEFFPVAID